MNKIMMCLPFTLLSFSLFAGATIFNCEAEIKEKEGQKVYATLLSNLALQVNFKQGKIDAGNCKYLLSSKINELETKAKQIKIKYELEDCQGLSKSFRPRKAVAITFAPARQQNAVELHALEDQHPLICQDKNLDLKALIKAVP